ncbi:hypothetical protein [Streptomyces ziwulingensis]|uniref:Baseplate protein J-like domain-containing protein n=1 Tax=Streptomyces ziwulingensis TaxID=1045501 RepID=A0ABP9CUK0_9ACTN
MTGTRTLRWTVLPDGVVGKDAAGRDRIRFSVLITPVLTGSDRLDGYAGLTDWPRTLRGLTPSLALNVLDGDTVVATVTSLTPDDRYPSADSDDWTSLFRAGTPVRQPRRLQAGAVAPVRRTLRSYPGSAVHEHVTALYREVGVEMTSRRIGVEAALREARECEPPAPDPDVHQGWRFPSAHLAGLLIGEEVQDFAADPRPMYEQLDELLGPAGDGGGGGGGPRVAADPGPDALTPRVMHRDGNPAYEPLAKPFAFAEAHRFFDRRSAPGERTAAPAAPEAHRIDFHQACGLLGDYPELQRRFGLVVDLVCSVPDALADGRSLQVGFDTHPDHHTLNAPGLRPRTRVRYVPGSRFEPLPADEDTLRTGVLNLGSDAWQVTDLDLDGSALKYVDYARAIKALRQGDVSDQEPARKQVGTGTPAARGGGLTVLCRAGDRRLADRIGADGQRGAAAVDAELHAEDLVRGYRIDVGVASPAGEVDRWHSLCRRQGVYTVRHPGEPPVALTVEPDEGHVKASAVTATAPDADEIYGHQALFGWEGWSLVAPRPGKTIGLRDQPEAADPPVSADIPLETRFTARPGSLPALRYGHTYRLRARVADLAGNGLDHTAAVPEDLVTPAVTYLRWEPVPQPVIVPTKPFNEGESAERLVIRSTVEDDGTEISARLYSALRADVPDHGTRSGVDGLDRGYRHRDERHLAPPKCAVRMAEEHGCYEPAFGPDVPERVRRRYFASAAREAGSFLDTVVTDPENPGLSTDLLLRREIHVAKHTVQDTEPLTRLPLAHRGAGLKTGEFVVHDGDRLLLPYLPDPLARGVCLRGLPGTTGNTLVPFSGPWPQAKPFTLRVEEGEDEPRFQDTPLWRRLTVFLAKSETARVYLSCYLDAADLGLLNQWRLLTRSDYWAALAQPDRDFIAQASAAGENWLLTPWVRLDLVHAVEKPLRAPELSRADIFRSQGETTARLSAELDTHADSTGQVDVHATWSEWTDDVTQPGPRRFSHAAQLDETTVSPGDDRSSLFLPHEFGDTRHRELVCTPVATTRFREYFHPTLTADPKLITRTGPGTGVSVPSSRRPEPPDPVLLVPTFRWSRTVDRQRGRVTQTRTHAGLRLYLNRPWFSSGDDELLGVLLDPDRALSDQYATRWGIDPVWADTTPMPAPSAANFPNATTKVTGVPLAESTDTVPLSTSVAAFTPVFDEDRRLWYADIDIDPGTADATAYFPFLRLAVARYQPFALPGQELSPVVPAEFAQLPPDRTLTAGTVGNRPRLRLSGPTTFNHLGGRAGTGLAAVAGSRRVRATLQKRTGGDDLDWQPVGDPVDLTCVPDGTGYAWTVDFPDRPTELLARYRFLVEEHELYQSDEDTATDTVVVAGLPVPAARRLIHADHLPVGGGLLGGIVIDTDDP